MPKVKLPFSRFLFFTRVIQLVQQSAVSKHLQKYWFSKINDTITIIQYNITSNKYRLFFNPNSCKD